MNRELPLTTAAETFDQQVKEFFEAVPYVVRADPAANRTDGWAGRIYIVESRRLVQSGGEVGIQAKGGRVALVQVGEDLFAFPRECPWILLTTAPWWIRRDIRVQGRRVFFAGNADPVNVHELYALLNHPEPDLGGLTSRAKELLPVRLPQTGRGKSKARALPGIEEVCLAVLVRHLALAREGRSTAVALFSPELNPDPCHMFALNLQRRVGKLTRTLTAASLLPYLVHPDVQRILVPVNLTDVGDQGADYYLVVVIEMGGVPTISVLDAAGFSAGANYKWVAREVADSLLPKGVGWGYKDLYQSRQARTAAGSWKPTDRPADQFTVLFERVDAQPPPDLALLSVFWRTWLVELLVANQDLAVEQAVSRAMQTLLVNKASLSGYIRHYVGRVLDGARGASVEDARIEAEDHYADLERAVKMRVSPAVEWPEGSEEKWESGTLILQVPMRGKPLKAYRRVLGMVYKEPFSGISVVFLKGGMDVILQD